MDQKFKARAGELAQWFFRGPEFDSQQPHGSSQLFVMESNSLFWCVLRK